MEVDERALAVLRRRMRATERDAPGRRSKMNDNVAPADGFAAVLQHAKITLPRSRNDDALVRHAAAPQCSPDCRPDEPRTTRHEHSRPTPQFVGCRLLTASVHRSILFCREIGGRFS
jgi:hypothetical protein